MATLKSGWLQKQGGVLWKGWKKRYCVIYKDGEFAMYDGPNNTVADFRINMKQECKKLEVGFECGAINLPSNISDVEAVFSVVTKSRSYFLCAASSRECREWVGVLGNARTAVQGSKVAMAPPELEAPPPYTPMQYSQPLGGMAPGAHPAQYQTPPGAISHPGMGVPGHPGMGAPVYRQPMYAPQPMYGQPMYGQPMHGQPMQPMYVSQRQQQPQQPQQQSFEEKK